jgi:hypothetical protein
MRTLLLYYSNQHSIRSLCEASAKENQVDVLELRDRFEKGNLWAYTMGIYKAVCGTGSKIEEVNIDFEKYDSIIIATPVWGFNPVPAVNEFLHRVNLSGREVSGLLIHPGRSAGKAGDVLRKRIKLAGGSCCGIVTVPHKELKEKNCDIYSYIKLKFQRAV